MLLCSKMLLFSFYLSFCFYSLGYLTFSLLVTFIIYSFLLFSCNNNCKKNLVITIVVSLTDYNRLLINVRYVIDELVISKLRFDKPRSCAGASWHMYTFIILLFYYIKSIQLHFVTVLIIDLTYCWHDMDTTKKNK